MSAQRTYWHLADLRRVPRDYDIATSRLLYYPNRGFEVQTPIADWYRQHQQGSELQVENWEAFRDPRETTYTRYTDIQKGKEVFVDGLLRSVDAPRYDRELSSEWIRILDRVIGPLRFPAHGLQMIAAYLGSMAPSGRVVVTCMLQAADEVRRIQRLAQRMRQIQKTHASFGAESKAIWQENAHWQPLRRAVEKLLVTYDWGEALVALNFVLKPVFDNLFTSQWGRLAELHDDDLLAKILFSLAEDCLWHRDWSSALSRAIVEQAPENIEFFQRCIKRWEPVVDEALPALIELFNIGGDESGRVAGLIREDRAQLWRNAGLGPIQ